MQIYLGSDHNGVELKKILKAYLDEKFQGQEDASALDLGVFTNDSTDYPDIAREVCEKVLENKGALGILMCGSGVGMSISANRRTGIRAVLANNEMTAKLARSDDDANVLCLGAKFTSAESAKSILDMFLATPFEAVERRIRRVNKIETVMRDGRNTPDEGSC